MRVKSKPRNRATFLAETAGPNKNIGGYSGTITKTGKFRKEHSHRWRMWEKEGFLNAIPKPSEKKWIGRGPPDPELCQKILDNFKDTPGLTVSDIESYINAVLKKVRRVHLQTDTCIEKWLEVVDGLSTDEKDLETQLSLVMLVAKQEPPDEIQQSSFNPDLPRPNFKAIYDYFSCAFSDKPLPELSPIDSLVAEDCMQSLSFQIECLDDEGLRRSLRRVFLHYNQDPDEDLEADQEEMRKNLSNNSTILNPMGLNAQAIVPVVPE